MIITTSGLTKELEEIQEIVNAALILSRENPQTVYYIFQKEDEIFITGNDYVKQISLAGRYEVIGKTKGGLFVL